MDFLRELLGDSEGDFKSADPVPSMETYLTYADAFGTDMEEAEVDRLIAKFGGKGLHIPTMEEEVQAAKDYLMTTELRIPMTEACSFEDEESGDPCRGWLADKHMPQMEVVDSILKLQKYKNPSIGVCLMDIVDLALGARDQRKKIQHYLINLETKALGEPQVEEDSIDTSSAVVSENTPPKKRRKIAPQSQQAASTSDSKTSVDDPTGNEDKVNQPATRTSLQDEPIGWLYDFLKSEPMKDQSVIDPTVIQHLDDFDKSILEVVKHKEPNATTGLKKHQREGITMMIRMESNGNRGGLLADDMGLGKTLQILGLIVVTLTLHRHSQEKPRKPTSIVAPSELVANWKKECTAWLGPDDGKIRWCTQSASTGRKKCGEFENQDIVITTYNQLP